MSLRRPAPLVLALLLATPWAAGAKEPARDGAWEARLAKLDSAQAKLNRWIAEHDFKPDVSDRTDEYRGLINRLLQAVEENRDRTDYTHEVAARVRVVCDQILRMAERERDRELIDQAQLLLRSMFYDSENAGAGTAYYRGTLMAQEYAAGAGAAYADALEQFETALAYTGRSARWSSRIQGHLHLLMAKHRVGSRATGEEGAKERRQALEHLDEVLLRRPLNLRSRELSYRLFGEATDFLVAHLVKTRDHTAVIQLADERLSAPFAWEGKAGSFMAAAESATELASEASPPGDDGPGGRTGPGGYLREKALHLGRLAFKDLQRHLGRHFIQLREDQLPGYHQIAELSLQQQGDECEVLKRYLGLLDVHKEFALKASTESRVRAAVCPAGAAASSP